MITEARPAFHGEPGKELEWLPGLLDGGFLGSLGVPQFSCS